MKPFLDSEVLDLCFALDQALWDILVGRSTMAKPGVSPFVDDVRNLRYFNRATSVNCQGCATQETNQNRVCLNVAELLANVAPHKRPVAEALLKHRAFKPISDDGHGATVEVDLDYFTRPSTFALDFTNSRGSQRATVEYHIRWNIRTTFALALLPSHVSAFTRLCDRLNQIMASPTQESHSNVREENPATLDDTTHDRCISALPFVQFLTDLLLTEDGGQIDGLSPCTALGFIQACRNAGLLHIESAGGIRIDTRQFDVHYILSMLFGFPSGILGFDDLFGGGGLFLGETREHPSSGRSILISGRFGSGKSLLSLQLAASVARKGGFAWVIALEQSPDECFLALASAGDLPDAREAIVTAEVREAESLLSVRRADPVERGVLLISTWEAGRGVEPSLAEFGHLLMGIESEVHVGLRILCIDPLSGVQGRGVVDRVERRAVLWNAVERLRTHGVNVILISDDESANSADVWFEENICDTVIRTSEKGNEECAVRLIEVQKSRMQRETRGKHAYEIGSGKGICVYPSTNAIDMKSRHRRLLDPGKQRAIRFGIDGIDALLGNCGVVKGDVIALSGDTSSCKVQFGLVFLSVGDGNGGSLGTSLLLDARESVESLRFQLEEPWFKSTVDSFRSKIGARESVGDDVLIHSLPVGNILPGQVLYQMETLFEEALERGRPIDKVVVNNIAHWEMSCPFVRDDVTFGDTLVNVLRRRHVTSLFVCGVEGAYSYIQRPIANQADCVIEFGTATNLTTADPPSVIVRVVKSRRMMHHRGWHELRLGNDGLTVRG